MRVTFHPTSGAGDRAQPPALDHERQAKTRASELNPLQATDWDLRQATEELTPS